MSLDIKFGVKEIPQNTIIENVSRLSRHPEAQKHWGFNVLMDRLLTGLKRRRLLRAGEG